MMIKEYKHLMELRHTHMEQMLLKSECEMLIIKNLFFEMVLQQQ